MGRHPMLHLLIAAALLSTSGASRAQAGRWHAATAAGMVPTQLASAVSARTLQSSLKAALSSPAPGQAPAQAVATLAFTRDATVTAHERDAIIAHLSQQPGGAAQLEPTIRSGRLMQEFDGLLQRYGYSPRNLGDVLAAHLVIAWEIVNDADSNDEPDGQRAVRRQLAGPLANVPGIARMSDAEKQAQAERTAYMTMIWGAAYQALKGGDDPAQLAELQRSVRGSLRKSGVDLERLALTDGGLVER